MKCDGRCVTCVGVSDDGDDWKLAFASMLPQQVTLGSQLVQLSTQLLISLLNINHYISYHIRDF